MVSLLTILLVAQSGLISGTASDSLSLAPVEGANIVVIGTRAGVATGEKGGFVLGPMKAGRYRLVASHIGFEPETADVQVPFNGVARVSFRLVPKVISVPGVSVTSRREIGEEKLTVREISSEQLQRNAGGFVADPVRTLSFLPGVGHSSRGEWSGTYAVRGGDPDESTVYFDNTELLWPYHLLGFSSVINSDVVERMSFYPSAFPVSYGGVLSSVTVVQPKAPERGEGFWAYDPMNIKAAYAGNLGDIRFLGSYRRTFYYVLFGPMGAGQGNKPTFTDFTGQVSLPLSAGNRLKLTFVNGSDRISSSLRGVEEDLTEGGTSVSLEWDAELGRTKVNTTLLSGSHDFSLSPAEWGGSAVTEQREFGLRVNLACPLSREVEIGAGLEAGRQNYSGNLLSPSLLQRADNSAAVYASLGVKPVQRVGIDLGLRYEDVRWTLDRVVQPRAVLSFFPSEAVTLKAGFRRLHQHSYSFLRSSTTSFVFDEEYDDYRLFELGALGAKSADHYSVSGSFRLVKGTAASVEAYEKDYSGLPTWQTDGQGGFHSIGNQGIGFSRGLEFTLEQSRAAGWSGWVTYGLSWCRKQQGTDTMMYWDKYDRRDALNLSVQKVFKGNFTLTATFHLNTGAPYTPLLYTRSPDGIGGADLNRGTSRYVIVGEKNSARVPTYHRLDLKLSKDLPKLPLHPYLYVEVLNIYNQQNAYHLVQFEARGGEIVTGRSDGIPLTPLIGIGGRF